MYSVKVFRFGQLLSSFVLESFQICFSFPMQRYEKKRSLQAEKYKICLKKTARNSVQKETENVTRCLSIGLIHLLIVKRSMYVLLTLFKLYFFVSHESVGAFSLSPKIYQGRISIFCLEKVAFGWHYFRFTFRGAHYVLEGVISLF